MLPRAICLLLILGVALASAVGYEETRDYNNRNRNYNQQQQYASNNQNTNYGYGQSTPRPYYTSGMDQSMIKPERSLFCYINGSNISGAQQQSYRAGSPGSYNAPNQPFDYESINYEHCTHLVFGGAYLDRDFRIKGIDPEFERKGVNGNQLTFDKISDLKNKKGNLKILLSISGDPDTFANMARSQDKRSRFVANAMNYVDGDTSGMSRKFDGIVIDWQFPNRNFAFTGVRDEDQYFVELMRDLKLPLRNKAKIVAAVLPPTTQNLLDGYRFKDLLAAEVDYFIIMAMEYYGHQADRILPNAPVNLRDSFYVEKTIDAAVKAIGQQEAYRLILAIPFYGKRYQLHHELGSNESPIDKPFTNHHTPAHSGIVLYRDVCQHKNNQPRDANYWRFGWDERSKTPWIVNGVQVILYEDTQSVREKAKLAFRYGLGGVMAFSLDMDDYEGRCGSAQRTSTHSDRNTYGSSSTNNRQSNYDNYNYGRVSSFEKSPLLQALYEAVENPNSAAMQSSPLALIAAIVAAMLLRHFG